MMALVLKMGLKCIADFALKFYNLYRHQCYNSDKGMKNKKSCL